MHQFMNGPRGLFMAFVFFTFLVVVGVAIISFLRRRDHHQHGASRAFAGAAGAVSTAQQLLDERFARGEIDVEEFKTRRGLLQGL